MSARPTRTSSYSIDITKTISAITPRTQIRKAATYHHSTHYRAPTYLTSAIGYESGPYIPHDSITSIKSNSSRSDYCHSAKEEANIRLKRVPLPAVVDT